MKLAEITAEPPRNPNLKIIRPYAGPAVHFVFGDPTEAESIAQFGFRGTPTEDRLHQTMGLEKAQAGWNFALIPGSREAKLYRKSARAVVEFAIPPGAGWIVEHLGERETQIVFQGAAAQNIRFDILKPVTEVTLDGFPGKL